MLMAVALWSAPAVAQELRPDAWTHVDSTRVDARGLLVVRPYLVPGSVAVWTEKGEAVPFGVADHVQGTVRPYPPFDVPGTQLVEIGRAHV